RVADPRPQRIRVRAREHPSHEFRHHTSERDTAMHRRDFLAVTATAAPSRVVRAADPAKDVRITRAVGFTLPSRRSKIAGKNARLDVHGEAASDRMVRLYTNTGVEALGNCRADEKAVAGLIG